MLPLLVSQKKDKRLSYLIVVLLAELTYLPDKDAESADVLLENLRKIKQFFLAPGVISTLIEHLAELLQEKMTEASEKHSQMIELIVIIFKNLLQIPKRNVYDDSDFTLFLLKKFNEESVFDSLVYMTQNFETELSKKLSFHFLEIFYFIFKDYWPCDFFNLTKKQTLKDFMKQEKIESSKKQRQRSTRHSRFGTNIVVKDKATQLSRIVHWVPKANEISMQDIGRKTAPKRKVKEAEQHIGMQIHKRKFGESNFAGSEEEEKVKYDLKEMALEMLEHSYNQLIEVLLDSFYSGEQAKDNEHEKYKYIKISSFFMAVFRLNAHEKLKEEKIKYRSEPHVNNGSEPSLYLPIAQISNSLKLQNIDFIFSKGFFQTIVESKRTRDMDMYLASWEYLLELLYLIQDMERSPSEKMRKNAQTLQQKLFTLQICELAKHGLKEFSYANQSRYFIFTAFRFTTVLLTMLEGYSKGKMLYIQTHRLKRKKESDDKYDDESGALEYSDDDKNNYIEKKFNFIAALWEFVEYDVVENVISMLNFPKMLDDELIESISVFINRIITQAKGTWIFYQLKTMNIFHNFLSENRKDVRFITVVKSIKKVLNSFFLKCKENPLLALEIIFPFSDKAAKDAILSNYEAFVDYNEPEFNPQSKHDNDSESEKELELEEFGKKLEADKWTDDEDMKLLEYYDIFKDNPEDCFRKLSTILNRPEEAIEQRLISKEIISSGKRKKAEEKITSLDSIQKEKYSDSKEKILSFIRKSIGKKIPHSLIIERLTILKKISSDYIETSNNQENQNEM